MRDEAAQTPGHSGSTEATQRDQHLHTEPATSPAASTPSKSPAPPRTWLSSVRRPRTSPGPRASTLKQAQLTDDETRRDSALASCNSTASVDQSTHHAPPSPSSLHKIPSLPAIVVQDEAASPSSRRRSQSLRAQAEGTTRVDWFEGLDTIIPTGSLDDLSSPSRITFSKRGSMMLGGKKANRKSRLLNLQAASGSKPVTSREAAQGTPPRPKEQEQSAPKEEKDQKLLSTPSISRPTTPHVSPSLRATSRLSVRGRATSYRVLSADESMLSRKVRSMYKHGDENAANWDGIVEEEASEKTSIVATSATDTTAQGSSLRAEDTSSVYSSRRESAIPKEPTETAGGVEDWANIEGSEVDRYGFILPKKSGSRGSSNGPDDGPDEPRIQRVSTALRLVAEEPRKKGIGRSVSRARSSRSITPRAPSLIRKKSQRSRAQGSVISSRTTNTRNTPIRQATNRLPHNRDRRLMDEASDMLKLPPGLAELAEQAEGGQAAQAMRAKEIEREEKWRKMAKVVTTSVKGGGMMFEFDVKDPKVISRTWKGIPDRWRATAWYAFLAASAKKDKDSPTEEELIEAFYELQEECSPDDMQIDMDVPRTINRHIMFRRRYRGGQRLLFRVLHAMSLYLPDTGYVQGMAALTATLLCYYEEDKAFVMLVRLWMHRGLERLYESGFTGLMEALDDFEKNWMRGGDVAKQLEELCITSTAWGTRWYLTLFNYSLPFPAQLRVWDAFMLLGDISNSKIPSSKFSGDLDVLHATSAALIDATREILLDSDFENAMKVLTSWIPIKDEDLLMKVAKAEYKMRKKRASAE